MSGDTRAEGADGAEPLASRRLDVPSTTRLHPGSPHHDEILARHRAALAAGASSYVDPATGNDVFTSAFLAARGHCCATGCRHCPYVQDPDT